MKVRYKAGLQKRRPRPRTPAKPGPTRVARQLALAHHVERLIEAGEVSGYAEVARLLGVTRARATQIMNLLLLAPEIQERLLRGEVRVSGRKLRGVVGEAEWNEQGSRLPS